MMILIAYASRHGGTREIAEKIADHLEKDGFKVRVSDVGRVGDISDYEAVILGSAVYLGQWQKKAVRFVKKHAGKLTGKKVWIFSSGPTGEGDPVTLLNGWKIPGKLTAFMEEIGPEDIAVFHGVVIREKLGGLARFMIDKVESPVGDYRDWQMISNWAEQIGKSLKDYNL
jgi:menaquinone-dependent protoporphyrinogen oxidase